MRLASSFSIAVVFLSGSLVSCLEEEEVAEIENIEEKLDDQRFDIGRLKRIIAGEELKLAKFEQAAADLKETKELTASLEETTIALDKGQVRNAELSDAITLTQLEFDQYQGRYRVQVRKAAVGKNVDLSGTMGDDYKSVRIMGVSPLAIKIYMSSGPQTIPVRQLTPEVREMLQMDEQEVAAYLERKGEDVEVRAKKFKKWKEGQAGRDKEEANTEILQRIKDLKEEIYRREDAINIRLQQMKGWKAKASNLELQASRDRRAGKSDRMGRLADLAREKALVLSDMNSDSWIVVGRLKAELEDLKRMGAR